MFNMSAACDSAHVKSVIKLVPNTLQHRRFAEERLLFMGMEMPPQDTRVGHVPGILLEYRALGPLPAQDRAKPDMVASSPSPPP